MSDVVVEYRILRSLRSGHAEDASEFSYTINDMIKAGWELCGGTSTISEINGTMPATVFYQAMVRKEQR